MSTSTVEKKTHYGVKSCQGTKSVKDVNMGSRIVECVYNTFNFLDYGGDVLLKGSAKRSIKNNGPASSATAKIKHALFHDLTRLPGKIVELDERNIDGMDVIYAAVKMNTTTEGDDTLKNYEQEVYDNHSIGFNYMQTEMIERDAKGWDKVVESLINPEAAEGKWCIWVVKEIALWEGSTVAFGMNSLTPCLGIKADATPEEKMHKIFERMDVLNKSLRTGTQSDDMLQTIDLQFRQLKQMLAELSNPTPEQEREKAAEKKADDIVVATPLFSLASVEKYA